MKTQTNKLIYAVPAIAWEWALEHNTDAVVATAIADISYRSGRSVESIWEAPTDSEYSQIVLCVLNYLDCGVFAEKSEYVWGEYSLEVH